MIKFLQSTAPVYLGIAMGLMIYVIQKTGNQDILIAAVFCAIGTISFILRNLEKN